MDEMDGDAPFLKAYFCSKKRKIMEANEHQTIHIGHLIQAQMKADKRSISWLASQIPCTRNHVYKIFNKPTLDSNLILRISEAMQFNFFQYYTEEFKKNMEVRTGEKV